jgi:hypothetical protein
MGIGAAIALKDNLNILEIHYMLCKIISRRNNINVAIDSQIRYRPLLRLQLESFISKSINAVDFEKSRRRVSRRDGGNRLELEENTRSERRTCIFIIGASVHHFLNNK